MGFWRKLFGLKEKSYSPQGKPRRPSGEWWREGVNPQVADSWEVAETLFQAQQWEQAWQAYENITVTIDQMESPITTPELMAMIGVRQAAVLLRLNRAEEAEVYLDRSGAAATAVRQDQLRPHNLFDYHTTFAEMCAARQDEVRLGFAGNNALKISLHYLRDIEKTCQVIKLWLDALIAMEEWWQVNRVIAQVKLLIPTQGLSFNDSQRLTTLLSPYAQLLQEKSIEPHTPES